MELKITFMTKFKKKVFFKFNFQAERNKNNSNLEDC